MIKFYKNVSSNDFFYKLLLQEMLNILKDERPDLNQYF